MKFLLVPYIIIACVFAFLGLAQSNANKTSWGMVIFFILIIGLPVVAKVIGL